MATQIQSAQERLLLAAMQDFKNKCLEIFNAPVQVSIEVNQVPLSKVAFIAEVNKSLDLHTTDGKDPFSFVKIKNGNDSVEVSSYVSQLPF